MKEELNYCVSIFILFLQILIGTGLIIIGSKSFIKNPDNLNNVYLIALGVFLLTGSGRKEVGELFPKIKV